MRAAEGCRIVVRSIVHDETGNLVATGTRPFSFTIGNNETITGIERAVIGHQTGERLQFVCPPLEAYGDYRPELVFDAPRENFPADMALAPGAKLAPGGGAGRFQLKVLEITEKGARLDGNHPLAGRTLHFDLEIVEVARP